MDEPMLLIEVPAALNEKRLIGKDDTAVLKNDLALPDRKSFGFFRSVVLGVSGRRFLPLCVKVSG
jgi:hypothetical protein